MFEICEALQCFIVGRMDVGNRIHFFSISFMIEFFPLRWFVPHHKKMF